MTIVFTGSIGSVGAFLPPGPRPLQTMLENPQEEMEAELRSLQVADFAFIHLAAMVGLADCEADFDRACLINVEGSCKWFRAAAGLGCRHFVFVSSAHVFAPPTGRSPLRPDSPVDPRSAYARTKLLAEQALGRLAPEFSRTKLTIARVFSVLSPAPRADSLPARLQRQAEAKDFRPIPGLSYVRDFLDSRDIGKELVRLAQTPTAPPLVLICSGRPTSVRELAERIFREHGVDPQGLREAPARPGDIPYLVGEPTPF